MARGARLRTPPAMWGAPPPHSPRPRVAASLRLRPLKHRHPLRIARLCPQDRLRVVRAPSLEHDAELESAVPQWPILLEEHAMRFRELARSTALLRIGKRFRLGPKEATPLFEQLARVHLEPQSQLVGDGLDALPSGVECDHSRKGHFDVACADDVADGVV